ncbi:FMN-dependent NADH-azoreductase [Granulicella rosea]|uniref:FMN dependent NADH:quinone oxidoreductase n=1 Tax=Granulicella rosea TaxID=474952 RepID=A0A239K0K3_9BACT|nr:NAD(P)H-dependent oxidoreductase [Granulicella rosea]SNT11232.1 FMN-dependent NADH-azoreductase [Granulicella rosea]
MHTLLHVDSSPLYGQSVSRELTSAFVAEWKSAHPEGTVVYRDLSATSIPPLNADWLGAAFTPSEARTPQQEQLLACSDSLIAELEQAKEYVIGVPMHNYSVPSVMKLWIDQITRVGKTFSHAGGTQKGLLHGKKATFIIATGSIHDRRTESPSFNFVETYLEALFDFLGLTDMAFITVIGTGVLNHGQDRNAFLAPHLQAVKAQAQVSSHMKA